MWRVLKLRRVNGHGKLNGHSFVRNRQSCLVVELPSGPSTGVRATLPVLDLAV